MRKTSAYARKRRHVDPLRSRYDQLCSVYKVMGRTQLFTPAEQAQLSLPVHASFDGLLKGTAVASEFHTVEVIAAVCRLIGEQIGPEVVAAAELGQAGLARCWERHKLTGKWGLDGPARQDIAAVVDLHDQLLGLCTPGQLAEAMREVLKRAAQAERTEGTERTP